MCNFKNSTKIIFVIVYDSLYQTDIQLYMKKIKKIYIEIKKILLDDISK